MCPVRFVTYVSGRSSSISLTLIFRGVYVLVFYPDYHNLSQWECNGPRNRCNSSEHASFVRPLGIAPEDRAPAQIISAFVGLSNETQLYSGPMFGPRISFKM